MIVNKSGNGCVIILLCKPLIMVWNISPMLVRVQDEPIDFQSLINSMRNAEAGAIVTFLGTVRNRSGDMPVAGLFYESYAEMAEKSIREIIDEAIDRFSVIDVSVIHRIGRLDLTEDSVAVCVSAPHRKEAFRACEFVIDRIKESVPIWKKDIGVDGKEIWRD